jgi:hypothetical protein
MGIKVVELSLDMKGHYGENGHPEDYDYDYEFIDDVDVVLHQLGYYIIDLKLKSMNGREAIYYVAYDEDDEVEPGIVEDRLYVLYNDEKHDDGDDYEVHLSPYPEGQEDWHIEDYNKEKQRMEELDAKHPFPLITNGK